jgi:hypothetical protein
MGLKAAARELGRPVGEMGNPARGAGRTGASPSLTANKAVPALLRPKPDLAQLAGEPADVLAAAQAAVDAPDGGAPSPPTRRRWRCPRPAPGPTLGRGSAQADIVITALEDGMPLLFAEIDNCYGSAVKDVDGKERPMWRTRWWAPDGRRGDQPHLPLLLVFNRVGPRNPSTVIAQLAELTERDPRPGEAHLSRPVTQATPRTQPAEQIAGRERGAQMRYLGKQLKGTRSVASLLGVSQRTVERYVKDQIRWPRPDLAGRREAAVRARWQPRIRERARCQAATSTGRWSTSAPASASPRRPAARTAHGCAT